MKMTKSSPYSSEQRTDTSRVLRTTYDGFTLNGIKEQSGGDTVRTTLYAGSSPVAEKRGITTSYFTTDILGSVRSVTGALGTVTDSKDYDVFGTPLSVTNGINAWYENTVSTSYGYLGKPYDATTRLYNYGYRDYSPRTGRFTTVDPVRDGNNWYTYVQNDPVNYVDLWGLSASDSSLKSKSGPVLDMSNSGIRNPYEGVKTGLTDEQLDFIFSTEMRNLVGIPYVFGGNSSAGTDCSGSIILALENISKKAGHPITLPDATAKEMADGKVDYITPLQSVDASVQGNAGMLNFYSWNPKKTVEHVNVGVGQRNQEEKEQIIDATEGSTMNTRNNNPDQIVPATEGAINQTYTPYSTKSEPVKQGSINWTYLRGKIWGN